MSFAYYIILDNDEPGFDALVDGKALAHSFGEIDALCTQEGLGSLDRFIGQSAEEWEDLLGEEIAWSEEESDGAVWFDPEEGIAFFDALAAKVRANPTLRLRDDLLEELAECRRILAQAKGIGARWRLAIDI
jgi:hypothetical protein